MNVRQTVFSQLVEHLPHKEFQKCVARYGGSSNVKSFWCWEQLLPMAVRTINLPRKSARHRSLPSFDGEQALPHGIPE